jgi:hypothetical protein
LKDGRISLYRMIPPPDHPTDFVARLLPQDSNDGGFDIFTDLLPQIVYSLQNMEFFHHAEKRLLCDRGILPAAIVRDATLQLSADEERHVDRERAGATRDRYVDLLERRGIVGREGVDAGHEEMGARGGRLGSLPTRLVVFIVRGEALVNRGWAGKVSGGSIESVPPEVLDADILGKRQSPRDTVWILQNDLGHALSDR